MYLFDRNWCYNWLILPLYSADYRSKSADYRSKSADYRPKSADYRPKSADYMPKSACGYGP